MRVNFLQHIFLFLLVHDSEFLENLIKTNKSYCTRPHLKCGLVLNGLRLVSRLVFTPDPVISNLMRILRRYVQLQNYVYKDPTIYKTKTLYLRLVSRLVFTPDPVISNLMRKGVRITTKPRRFVDGWVLVL